MQCTWVLINQRMKLDNKLLRNGQARSDLAKGLQHVHEPVAEIASTLQVCLSRHSLPPIYELHKHVIRLVMVSHMQSSTSCMLAEQLAINRATALVYP